MGRLPGRTVVRLAALPLLMLAAACSRPQPPDKEQPPEPQAAATSTELRDAIQAPIDRAKAASPAVLDAARNQRDDIDAQAGGDATPAPQ